MKPITGYAAVNGTNIYYEMTGQGHSLVLIHGGLMDHRMWDGQFELFSEKYQVIRYNIRGYGKSEAARGRFSHIEDLYQLLKLLRIPKACVLGLSLGGQIAIEFTLEHPDIAEALIPVASGLNGYPYKDAEGLAARYEAIFKTAKEEGLEKAVDMALQLPFFMPVKSDSTIQNRMRLMIRDNYSTWSSSQENYLWPTPPGFERLSQIGVPTLVVVGDHDVSDILSVADALASKIKGARKVVIRNAGHHINMENPQEFNRAVLDFLGALH